MSPVYEIDGKWFYSEDWSDNPSDIGPFDTHSEAFQAYEKANAANQNPN